MDQRTCAAPGCGKTFTPTHNNQRYCPPTEANRSGKGQARSKCARRAMNAQHRGAPTFKVPERFDCAYCEKRCIPGQDVPAHASRFCSADHKALWHRREKDSQALLASFTAEPSRTDNARFRRAMRLDPCVYCGAEGQALDHIIPRSDEGPDNWDNRASACHSCNSTKQQSPLLIFLAWRQARAAFEPWRQIVAEIHTRAA